MATAADAQKDPVRYNGGLETLSVKTLAPSTNARHAEERYDKGRIDAPRSLMG